MPNSPDASVSGQLTRLKALVQTMSWRAFEEMVPKLVGRILNIRMSAAAPGFQAGGDAGTVGRGHRRLRIEAKRYGSDFDARDLVGGLRQAIALDPTLEAWIACATRNIPEQIANAIEREAAIEGISVLAIDWSDEQEPMLVALLTVDPKLVTQHAGEEAGALASALAAKLAPARERLSRELDEWQIGFDRVRAATHVELIEMWRCRRAALGRFGQDVAGGDGRVMVRRASVCAGLDTWWQCGAAVEAPAAVLGQGGVGKTWSALAWLVERQQDLPLVVTLPAGAVTGALNPSADGVLALLGSRMATIARVRDAAHWTRRLERLLKRPINDGPSLCLMIDGLNQNSVAPWLALMQVFQDRPFAGRVRVIVTSRPQFFEDDLGKLRRLAVAPQTILVERFDVAPGGELEQMLAAHGLSLLDLHGDLIEFARVPRLFDLIVRLRDRLVESGRVTTHRVLWEYGRDVHGERAGVSFSEMEWRAWLAEVARRERAGMRRYTLAELGDTTARPDLRPSDVAARLSDIVDGNLTRPGPGGTLQLVPDIVAHALGAALLERLDHGLSSQSTSIAAELTEWLDPIAGLEERAEVLRAATSILAERDVPARPEIAGLVVTAWLQTPNLPESHASELRRLAPGQTQAFLDAIEHSYGEPQAAARALAVDALRAVPSDDPISYGLIIATCTRWLSRIPRDVSRWRGAGEQMEAARAQRFLDRIGTDAPGPITVLGVPLELYDGGNNELERLVASVLDRRPLAGAINVLQCAALSMAIRTLPPAWDDFKWLCLLNEIDPQETAVALRLLSVNIAGRTPEPGIHRQLAARVGALLLWLTGFEVDEIAAQALDPKIEYSRDYAIDYLENPGRSLFRLERRHAVEVLADRQLPLHVRCDRAADFLFDPTVTLPATFVEDVRAAANAIDPSTLDRERGRTTEDYAFERLEVALARAAPEHLAALNRGKLASYAERPASSADIAASASYEAFLLIEQQSAAACRQLRERVATAGGTDQRGAIAALLVAEVAALPARAQIDYVLDAEPAYILEEFEEVLRPLSKEDVDALLNANMQAPASRLGHLICLLSVGSASLLSDVAWQTISQLALDGEFKERGCVFQLLHRVDAERFGTTLLGGAWSWSNDPNELCRHYGSLAVVESSIALPFEEVAPRIVPSLLPHAVVTRGNAPAEALLAAAILDAVLMRDQLADSETSASLSVDVERRRAHPLLVSITPGSIDIDGDDSSIVFSRNDDAHEAHSQRVIEKAIASVRKVWAAGASLYLSSINAEELTPIVAAAPGLVIRWVEGAEIVSRDFRRRVHLAEGFYLALCEALLVHKPEQGAMLWRALRAARHVIYKGRGGVSEHVLMLFRVVPSARVLELREELLRLKEADTDERLLDLAVASIAYGQEEWLSQVVARERAGNVAWQRRRAAMLVGFGTSAALPVVGTHLEGVGHSQYKQRDAAAARRLWRDACAKHWWRAFVEAIDVEAAFAAWTLFRRCADRRAFAWFACERLPAQCADDLARRKSIQVSLNMRALVDEAQRREKNGATHLFDTRVVHSICPWYRPGRDS